jgi:DNA-binding response OmpR family regulator
MDDRTIFSTSNEQPTTTIVGNVRLDRETVRAWRGNRELRLSMRQFRILDIFMKCPGEPVSRNTLKNLVWGEASTIEEHTIDSEIVRLRRALGAAHGKKLIRTVRKIGYVLEAAGGREKSMSCKRQATNR